MYANSTILGKCDIGNHVILGAGTLIVNESVPDNCVVCGRTPNLKIIKKTEKEMKKRFEEYWNLS